MSIQVIGIKLSISFLTVCLFGKNTSQLLPGSSYKSFLLNHFHIYVESQLFFPNSFSHLTTQSQNQSTDHIHKNSPDNNHHLSNILQNHILYCTVLVSKSGNFPFAKNFTTFLLIAYLLSHIMSFNRPKTSTSLTYVRAKL